MRIKNWDYRELRERIRDGYTLRKFTGFYSRPVPKHNAFNQAFNRLTAATVQKINDAIIQAAVEDGLEDGNKLRADTTVVESDIHWPTDATLLWDTVRVLTRLIGQLGKVVPAGLPLFSNHKRSARRRMQILQRMSSAQRQHQQVPVYRELLKITQEVLSASRRTAVATEKLAKKNLTDPVTIAALRRQIIHYCAIGDRVLDQAERRILKGEKVPASEKIYSIFEPHTDLIKRGKVNKPVEFGHKVFLAESACGLVTQYRVLDGNPPDQEHVAPSLERHQELFGHAPKWYGADRGFASPENERACQQAGVAVNPIPQRGG